MEMMNKLKPILWYFAIGIERVSIMAMSMLLLYMLIVEIVKATSLIPIIFYGAMAVAAILIIGAERRP